MLHTKFRENWPAKMLHTIGFVKNLLRFWRKRYLSVFFTIYGHSGHLGHVIRISRPNLCSTYPWMLHIKFHFDRPSGFREDLRKVCMDDRPVKVKR